MKQFLYRGRFIFVPIAIAAALSLVSFIVMLLWNNLLPDILQVTTITFWQAMGLFVLCKILFGFGKGNGGGKFGGGPPWMRHKMAERFNNMTDEEKEKFREEMKNRACNWKGRGRFNRDFESFDTETTEAKPNQ